MRNDRLRTRYDPYTYFTVLCCLVLLLSPTTALADASTTDRSTARSGSFSQAQFDSDEMAMRVDLRANGSAAWSVEYRIRLETENETAAFEELQRDIRANRSEYLSRFETNIAATVAAAQNATGREMSSRNFTVQTEQRQFPNSYGIITYRFEWDGFAAVDENTVRAGDALSGLFLDDSESLTLTWPDGYERASVTPSPDDTSTQSVRWAGDTNFGDEQPRLVLESESNAGGESGVPTWALGLLAIVVLGAVAGYWRYRDSQSAGPETASDASDSDQVAGPTQSSAQTTDPTPSAGDSTTAGTDQRTESTHQDTGPEAGAATSERPDPELLSNEERVIQLLEAEGGRIKQQDVVSEFDWTAARTSQIVGGMREDDSIEVFRLGRENVIKLPDEEASEN